MFRIPGRDVRSVPCLYTPSLTAAQTCLASDDDQNYATTCKIPGMLLVDKSRFVSLSHCQFDQAWLPIIRRPTGFGKTMLLSMMENYVDIDSCHAPFPSADDALPAYLVSLPARGLLLVLHLDFGRLSLPASMSVPDLERACCAFLSSASAKCYGQYRRRLHDQGDHTVLDIIDFSGLLVCLVLFLARCRFADWMLRQSLARMQDCRFFVGIDNYTAPLANGARHVLEPIIVSKILQPIFAAKAQGIVWRGFMLGDDLPGSRRFSPYCSSKLFNEQTLDLSWDPVASDILGIAEDEVVALGTALFGPGKDLLQQVRLHAEVPAEEMDLPSNDWRTYSVRDVLALARALQHSPNDTASYGGHIKSITSNDYLPPTRYLPESFSKGLEPYIDVEDCVDGAPSAQETTVPTSSVKFRAKPRKMHPVSEDGSRSDSDSYRTGSFASRGSESPPSSTFSGPASSTHSSPSAPMKGKKT